MPLPSILDSCKLELYTDEQEIRDKYTLAMAERILRIRELYNYWLANPSIRDRQLRDTIMSRFEVSQSTAYSDIALLHQLIPMLSKKNREFHRCRFEEMSMETYAKAKARNDTRSMAAITATYGKITGCDKDDETTMPISEFLKQPFCPSLDPTLLGLKPIPDYYNYVARLEKEFLRDLAIPEEVEYEEIDLELDKLFAPINDDSDQPEG